MPKLGPDRLPKMRRHAKGQFVVHLSGTDHYLGHDEPEARRKYGQLTAQWQANGRRPLRPPDPAGPTIGALIERYRDWAAGRYVKRKTPDARRGPDATSQVKNVTCATAPLLALFEDSPIAGFTIDEMALYRARLIGSGLAAKTINTYCEIVRRMFKWAARSRLAPPTLWMELKALEGVRNGIDVPARPRVVPPRLDAVRAAQGLLRAPNRAMIDVQLLTGMRPGEVCGLRPCDLHRAGPVDLGGVEVMAGPTVLPDGRTVDVWLYVVPPHVNKTEHRSRPRVVPIGPAAQQVLSPWLARCPASREVFINLQGRRFAVDGYRLNVAHACDRAGVGRWWPNQLRHYALTDVRRRYGIEAARTVGGHSDAGVTLLYAEADVGKAMIVAAEMG